MKVDSSQVEDKVLKAAGVVAEAQLQEAPKVEEVDIIPKRNAGAMRSDQVCHNVSVNCIGQDKKCKRSICFHSHGEGPYLGLLLVERTYN